MTVSKANQMAEDIINYCIIGVCANRFWDECKEIVRAMFMTACELADYEVDTAKSDEWLSKIANCFDDWNDRDAFINEFENFMVELMV